MKEVISIFMSATVLVTSCNQAGAKSQRPQPATAASPQQIESTESRIVAEQNSTQQNQSQNQQSSGMNLLNNQAVNFAVQKMMESSDLYIKDFNGVNVSHEAYRLNPSQYFILFKESKESLSYAALNTSTVLANPSAQNKSIAIDYKIYKITGDIKDFKGQLLGAPSIQDSVVLEATLLGMASNKEKVDALIERLKSSEIFASSGFLMQLDNFMFPKAYAGIDTDTYSGKLLLTAIIFSSISVISYFFSWYTTGTITMAVGITMWFLYWFTPKP
jgi:hypothetical protein